jgi:RNA polymerase sigma-70 factor (ECF subfamily)
MYEAAVTAPTIAAPTRPWICALHADLLGRSPDPQELARWLAAHRGTSHREIASAVLRSDEYCRAQIAELYRSLLDREADPAGLEAWTQSLSSGTALQDVVAGFCDTFEYKANQTTSAFIESLYQRLLNRAPDADGKAARLAALRNRSSTFAVIRGFLCSSEYCTQRVTEVHRQLLGRDPERAELPERVLALMQGTALQHIVLGLVTSHEYIARAASRYADVAEVADPPRRTDAGPQARRALDGPQARHGDPDEDALRLVRDGDLTAALKCLMQRHGGAVYRYCRVALNDATLAADVQQQVFIEAHRDLPRFAGRSTLRTWLLGIARHRVLDAVKLRRRVQAHLDEDARAADPPDPGPSPEQWLDDARLVAALLAAVAELDERVRTTLLLRYQQGMTFEEMAEITGENAGTLQARVARALRRLRERIEQRLPGSP